MTAVPRCAGCRRRLKQPSPNGYGPVCAQRLGLTPHRTPTIPRPPASPDAIPGQDELPLADQPTLWPL